MDSKLVNRNELIEYLRDPASLTAEGVKELEEVVAETPYFQSVRMLLAKGSKDLGLPSAKKHLASAAIFATDRPLLKKYINGQLLFLNKPTDEVEEQKPKTKRPPSPKTVGTWKSAKPEKKREGPRETQQKQESKQRKLAIPEIPTGTLDAMLEELDHDMEDLKTSRSKFADIQQQIEEEDAVSEALERAETISQHKKEEEEKILKATEEAKKQAVEEVNIQEAKEAKKQEEETGKKDKEIVLKRGFGKRDTLSTDLERLTQETLKKPEAGMREDTREFDKEKKTPERFINKPADNQEAKKTTGTKKKDDDGPRNNFKVTQKQIIDKFIKKSPSMSKVEKAKKVEGDLSDKNSSWNKELASESLAEIYLNQGNKKRAIEIYEILSLKLPEKKPYFAGLISKIK